MAACTALLLFGAGSAQAAKSKAVSPLTEASQCLEATLTQPFLYAGDTNYYTLTPGQTPGNFDGTGWVLSGGASIKQTTLASGSAGSVLDLPSGSKAVSPSFCVTSEYPTARTIVRNVVGSEGVFFHVSYQGTSTWENPKNTGQVHGAGRLMSPISHAIENPTSSEWTLPAPVNMQPENVLGWQVVRITLIPGGKTSDFQLYNLYIDPYRR